ATWFIPLPIFGQVAVGTLIFGITFDQRDRLHHYHGRKAVYWTIGITALLNILESALLGVSPRIIIASLTAIILSEGTDTEIYQKFLQRPWLERVVRSNAISIPMDTVLFNCIAFLGVFAPVMLISIMFGEILVKAIVSGVVALWRVKGSPRTVESTNSAP
ncbi:MAG: VUT family protein, partial [Elainellaceae cyanobacterium]